MEFTGMWRWPRITPGKVSTSRSFMVSRCFCAKPRTCACANLMSSRSRFKPWPTACWFSCGVVLNFCGAPLSNCCERSRTASSPRCLIWSRMPSTVARTFASASSIAPASIPRLRKRGIELSYSTAVIPEWSPGMTSSKSFDRLRIDRRPRSAGNDQRRTGEEELVDLVRGAILGEFLEIEDLAHAQTHRGDYHPVPGLVGVLGLVPAHLAAPSVG